VCGVGAEDLVECFGQGGGVADAVAVGGQDPVELRESCWLVDALDIDGFDVEQAAGDGQREQVAKAHVSVGLAQQVEFDADLGGGDELVLYLFGAQGLGVAG
jgi:hypothetical protein